MRPFAYDAPTTPRPRRDAAVARAGRRVLAGGTTLLDLMKLDVMRPRDGSSTSTGLAAATRSSRAGDGAEARRARPHGATPPTTRSCASDYPVVAEALLARRRRRSCATWRRSAATCCSARAAPTSATRPTPCNKREPGTRLRGARRGRTGSTPCSARSDACIATYPATSHVALVALDADGRARAARAAPRLPSPSLHRLPGDTPQHRDRARPRRADHRIRVPAGRGRRPLALPTRCATARRTSSRWRRPRWRSTSTANVREARIALGGVGDRAVARARGRGRAAGRPLDEPLLAARGRRRLRRRPARRHNAFKVELAQRDARPRAAEAAAGGQQA